jgi:uncharacterized protein (UPF0276 family)
MTTSKLPELGLGIGWRPEIALMIERRQDIGFVEVIAESIDPKRPVPDAIRSLQSRGARVVPHGISLSLGGAEPLDLTRVKHLAAVAKHLGSPLVSEHIAFVRAGGVESGHLLPIPRTRASLDVLVDNVNRAQDVLATPLALENISALFNWPDAEMTEAEFVRAALERTGAMMLLDLSNVHANARNLGDDPLALLDALPLDRIAYVHVAGGSEHDGLYHDTHTDPVPPAVLDLVTALCERHRPPALMLERDGHYPPAPVLTAELDAIADAAGLARITP